MAPLGRRVVTYGDQQLSGELPNGLEHAEPRLAVTHLGLANQTVVDQGGQPVQRVDAEIALRVADRFHGLEAGATPKHRQPGEQTLLGFREQAVTPVDGGPQCALSRWQVACGGSQQVKPAQPGINRLRSQHLDPACSQLDGEWQAVETGADVSHEAGVPDRSGRSPERQREPVR